MDDDKLMVFTTLPALLLLMIMRRRCAAATAPTDVHAAMDCMAASRLASLRRTRRSTV